jgi:uncharacterized cupin superfamily protein
MPTDTPAGPRLTYRPPGDGIAAPEDYPDAPISLVVNHSTPGADLFGVAVAIGGDIPMHLHSMMEFQYVVSGVGLALNADGAEIPISPGGTVVSPARAAGAHGFRNTGGLPLTLLCIYPSPGGANPDRSPFDMSAPPGAGPRTSYVGPTDVRPASAQDPGVRVARILDASDPGAELFAQLMSISDEVPRHHHPTYELQYVIAGCGQAIDVDGREIDVGPGGVLSSPAGPSGAHGFRNTGSLPLQMLCVFYAPGGAEPERILYPAG